MAPASTPPASRAETPSGMPSEDTLEDQPMGPTETDPDAEETDGSETMPGIPTEGEPPSGG